MGASVGGFPLPFGFLPQRFHLTDVGVFELPAALGQLAFDVAEAIAELGVGPAQGLLGIHLDEARQVDQHEQQVAQLVFQLGLRRIAPRLAESAARSPKTCGWRRISLALMASSASPIENSPCSPAIWAWNTACNMKSPSSSASPFQSRRSMASRTS